MGNLGKIFGPLVLVLALAAAVFSFLLFQQRMKFRERAAIMAEALVDITTQVDADAQSGAASKVTFTKASNGGKEGGSLGWESCKKLDFKTSNAFNSTVDETKNLVRNVQAQRQELRDKIIEIAKSLNCQGNMLPVSENMGTLADYATSLDGFATYTKNFNSRFNTYVNQLNAIAAKTAGKNMPKFNAASPNGASTAADNTAFAELNKRVGGMVSCLKTLGLVAVQAQGKLSEFSSWTFKANRLSSIDFTQGDAQLKPVLEDFLKDIQNVNNELVKYGKLKTSYASLEDKYNDLNTRFAQMEKDSAEKDELIKRLQGLTFPGITFEGAKPLASIEEVKADTIGSIVNVDPQYKVIVLNLNQSQVVPELRVAICSGETYIGSAKIISANDFNSVAVLLNGDIKKVAVGQSVLVSDTVLQNAE